VLKETKKAFPAPYVRKRR